MTKAARERLARLLGGEEAAAFSGQVSLPADALSLEVEGVVTAEELPYALGFTHGPILPSAPPTARACL
jgi:hypothetical protein